MLCYSWLYKASSKEDTVTNKLPRRQALNLPVAQKTYDFKELYIESIK